MECIGKTLEHQDLQMIPELHEMLKRWSARQVDTTMFIS